MLEVARSTASVAHEGGEFFEQRAEAVHGGAVGLCVARRFLARSLELTLAQLQGRPDALVCATGIGAIASTLLSLTKQGDHVLCFVELYGPTRHLVRRTLAKFGVTHTLLSIEDLGGIERVLSSVPTRLVVFESPTNPINRVADIAAIARLARRHGALTALDNTLAGPHQHGQYDVDIFFHSLTKFAAGHGDVMKGCSSLDISGLEAVNSTGIGIAVLRCDGSGRGARCGRCSAEHNSWPQ